jgi:hypothetical protein
MLSYPWYVIRNKENATILNEWSNKMYKDGAFMEDEAFIFSDRSHANRRYVSEVNLLAGRRELSFGEFKQYVLNEQPKEIIPLIFN